MGTSRRHLLGLALMGATHPLLGAAHPLLRAAPPRSAADARTDRALAAIASDPARELASLSVMALRAGRPVYQAQFGLRSIERQLPANAATLYRIASVSKLVTTIGVLRLVEAGRLDLDADVSGYLGFTLRNPHFADRAITLRSLMSHTSSLRDDAGYSWPLATALSTILQAGAPNFGSGAMWAANAGPGDFFTYCNLAWGVIGTLMERVTGERFDRLMQRLVLSPMDIHGGYHPSTMSAADVGNIATLYRKRTVDTEVWNAAGPWIAQADQITQPPPPPPGADTYIAGTNATPFSPTGGLRITAAGLATIMRMLMADGRHGRARLLQPATIEQMFRRQWTYDPLRQNGDTSGGLFLAWGLGNQQFPDAPGSRLIDDGGFNAVGHLGDAYGLRSLFVFERASGTGYIAIIGGTASDPEASKGIHSPLARVEERVLDAIRERTRHA